MPATSDCCFLRSSMSTISYRRRWKEEQVCQRCQMEEASTAVGHKHTHRRVLSTLSHFTIMSCKVRTIFYNIYGSMQLILNVHITIILAFIIFGRIFKPCPFSYPRTEKIRVKNKGLNFQFLL